MIEEEEKKSPGLLDQIDKAIGKFDKKAKRKFLIDTIIGKKPKLGVYDMINIKEDKEKK